LENTGKLTVAIIDVLQPVNKCIKEKKPVSRAE